VKRRTAAASAAPLLHCFVRRRHSPTALPLTQVGSLVLCDGEGGGQHQQEQQQRHPLFAGANIIARDGPPDGPSPEQRERAWAAAYSLKGPVHGALERWARGRRWWASRVCDASTSCIGCIRRSTTSSDRFIPPTVVPPVSPQYSRHLPGRPHHLLSARPHCSRGCRIYLQNQRPRQQQQGAARLVWIAYFSSGLPWPAAGGDRRCLN